MKSRPLIIAHRGFSGRYPENTLPAVRAALDLGVDFVEIDVHETRDGELIVFHDYRLKRICGVRGKVRDATLSAIKRLNSQVPTLAEVLRVCRGRARVLIEIKRADPRKVAALINKLGMEREVIVFSLSVPRMRTLAEAAPHVARFGLIARNLRFSLHALRRGGPGGPTLHVRGVALSRRLVTAPRVVQEIHRRGWKLFVWTVNRESEMEQLARWGVDGIITNHPDRALALTF
ncbi:MAG TPA: glycerophosphodiester phosphodiesterase [Verrucomicrobiae bacterium]|nr:glycerophosphodiester phosphodiesterase [Verrucomicrobiae bacterium]